MHTTKLGKIGDSVMLAVPPALLDMLQLRPGDKAGSSIRELAHLAQKY